MSNIEKLFNKNLEEIYIDKQTIDKGLNEKRVYLHDIIKNVEDEDLKKDLLNYEEQQNFISVLYLQAFYNAGFCDALSLL